MIRMLIGFLLYVAILIVPLLNIADAQVAERSKAYCAAEIENFVESVIADPYLREAYFMNLCADEPQPCRVTPPMIEQDLIVRFLKCLGTLEAQKEVN